MSPTLSTSSASALNEPSPQVSTPAASALNEPPPPLQVERLLGRVVGKEPGPTLIAIGGVHGNEPSGVLGLKRVLAALEAYPEAVRGEFVALAGNIEALARRLRFVDRDLNRCWTRSRVAELKATPKTELETVEDAQQLELLAEIEAAVERRRGETYSLDLHSTSGGGPPFLVLADTLRNRAVAERLEAPMVLGLEEELGGTLLAYLSDRGHISVAFESGQHDSPHSVDNAEAAIWLTLATAGVLDTSKLEVPSRPLESLRLASAGLPLAVETRFRQPVEDGDGFRMEPGFINFQEVEKGQLLAHAWNEEVRAPESGRVLMPLYQKQGDDGFFLVRPFNPGWLKLSAWLRRARVDAVAHWLPGVRRHPDEEDTFIVNRRVARWFALELFHLLGFRRHGKAGRALTVSRRPHDQS